MKALVSFKVCPDIDQINAEDIVITEEMGIDTHFLPRVLNCYDESSLELAIRFSEGSPNAVEKAAISIGGEYADIPLKTLIALGYDHAVRVNCDEEQIRFQPEYVATAIAEYALQSNASLIMIGTEAPTGNNSATAPLVSFVTGYPLVSSVVDIAWLDESSVLVKTSDNGRILEQEVSLPCVLSIGDAVVSKLRVPTLRARMNCKDKKPELFVPSLDQASISPKLENLRILDRRRKVYISPFTGISAINDVLQYSLKERLETL